MNALGIIESCLKGKWFSYQTEKGTAFYVYVNKIGLGFSQYDQEITADRYNPGRDTWMTLEFRNNFTTKLANWTLIEDKEIIAMLNKKHLLYQLKGKN